MTLLSDLLICYSAGRAVDFRILEGAAHALTHAHTGQRKTRIRHGTARRAAPLIQQECIRRELITSDHVHNFVQYYDYEHTDSDRSL